MIRIVAPAMIAVLAVSWFGVAAPARDYPDRPLELVVPFPAGGATDSIARPTAQRLQSALGQTVIIENQGGAGGTIGTRQVARASPEAARC